MFPMTDFLWLWRPGGLAAGDVEALARGGHHANPEAPSARGDGEFARWGSPPPLEAAGGHGPTLTREGDDLPQYVAALGGAVLGGSRVGALLATGLLPRRLDAAGLSGWLWRGAALDAHLPVVGLHAVPRGGRVRTTPSAVVREVEAAPPERGAPDDWFPPLVAAVHRAPDAAVLTHGGHASLALLLALEAGGRREPEAVTIRWARPHDERVAEAGRSALSVGARHRVVEAAGLDVAGTMAAYLAETDLPSVAGFLARAAHEVLTAAGVRAVLASTGGDALFGTLGFARRTRPAPRDLLDRSRPPRQLLDPLDVVAQAERERRAYRRVPVNAAHAALALVPAATRTALLREGSRPPDPLRPRHADLVAAASELAVRSVYPDQHRRERAPSLLAPYLDLEVVRAALSVPPAARMGRPGSAGRLARRVRAARGWATRRRAPGPLPVLEGWLRGPLAPWLEATLGAGGADASGAFRGDAVGRAWTDWRRGALGGLDAPCLLALGLCAAWVRREGLRRDER